MNGNLNNNMYNITTEGDVSNVLMHLSGEYTFDILEDQLKNRVGYYQTIIPNMVNSLNQNFKALKADYEGMNNEINEIERNTYIQIINRLCVPHRIIVSTEENFDLFTAASLLYDFLISNFYNNIVNFYANFIIANRNSIYDTMRLNDSKKNKNAATIYNKKIYKNQKLAVISANLEEVIYNMSVYDISIKTIYNYIYSDKKIAEFMSNIFMSNANDFYYNFFNSYFNTDKKAIIITSIRLTMQQQCVDEDNNINIIGG
jgi:hypothetical protein